MTTHSYEARLRDLILEITRMDPAAIGLDDDLVAALRLDSLASLRLLAAVEKQFSVQFPDDVLVRLRTMRKLLAALDEATKER